MITQLIQPTFVKTRSVRYIRYLIAGGIVIFGVIVVTKVMKILGLKIFP